MISYKTKKTVLYKELDSAKRKEFFDFTQKKFMHNVDTLYYTIKVNNDWNYDPNCQVFKGFLDEWQHSAVKVNELMTVFSEQTIEKLNHHGVNFNTDTSWVMNGIPMSKIYRYDLQMTDKFVVLIAPSLPNQNTPEILVQLRSQFLWLNGDKRALDISLKQIKDLLSMFNISIKEVVENRIDYAYHTNYVQDPTNYFKSENINKMQCSNFKRGSIEFSFRSQWVTEVDYVTFGRKKSNNLFFRIYDKTKEVIQQGYKQFFIQLWYLEKLINFFDMYCIEKAFLNPSSENYKYLDIARLEFYLEYGKDEDYKKEIHSLLNINSTKPKKRDYDKIIELANILTPPVTKVLNFEIETKRKFYSTMDSSINNVLQVYSVSPDDPAAKLYRIIDNKQAFHNFITKRQDPSTGVIRFIDYKAKNRLGKGWVDKSSYPTSDLWQRLQSCKLSEHGFDVELVRNYQCNLDLAIVKKRLINMVGTFSLYAHGDDVGNGLYEDLVDLVGSLNETDFEAANQYKKKKLHLIGARLEKVEGQQEIANRVRLIDTESGELY